MMDFILETLSAIRNFFTSSSFDTLVGVLKVIFIIVSIIFAVLIVVLIIKSRYLKFKITKYRWHFEKPESPDEAPQEKSDEA